jgi:hypothetical protein
VDQTPFAWFLLVEGTHITRYAQRAPQVGDADWAAQHLKRALEVLVMIQTHSGIAISWHL